MNVRLIMADDVGLEVDNELMMTKKKIMMEVVGEEEEVQEECWSNWHLFLFSMFSVWN